MANIVTKHGRHSRRKSPWFLNMKLELNPLWGKQVRGVLAFPRDSWKITHISVKNF